MAPMLVGRRGHPFAEPAGGFDATPRATHHAAESVPRHWEGFGSREWMPPIEAARGRTVPEKGKFPSQLDGNN